MEESMANPPRRRPWGLRFSLRSLLLVMLLVAVYLGGRSSQDWQSPFTPQLAGSWTATMPRGHLQQTTLTKLGSGEFQLTSRASVLNGTYRWQNGELKMVTPADKRMVGLVWKWDGKQLLLVGEPANTPTGSSYMGTRLDRTK